MTTVARRAPLTISRSALTRGLLYAYAFLAPLGHLVRFGDAESAFGLTTFVLIAAILLSIDGIPTAFNRMRTFLALLFLVAWTLCTALLAPNPVAAGVSGASLLVYLCVAAVAAHRFSDDFTAMRLLTAYAAGALVSAGATVIDFAGLVAIPGVNDTVIATRVDIGDVEQASGVFPRRSAMAVYYSFSISMGLLVPLACRHLRLTRRIFFAASGVLSLLALALTHNRAGVLGSAVALGLIVLLSSPSPIRLLRTGLILAIVGALFIGVVNQWFPDIWIAYQAQLGIGNVSSTDAGLRASDNLRLVILWHVLQSLATNPLGHGYSYVAGVPGYGDMLWDPHNIFTQVIWAAGVFGAAWLVVQGRTAARNSLRLLRRARRGDPDARVPTVILGGLTAFLMVGMTHTPISTGIAWLLFGILVRLSTRPSIRDTSRRVGSVSSPPMVHSPILRPSWRTGVGRH